MKDKVKVYGPNKTTGSKLNRKIVESLFDFDEYAEELDILEDELEIEDRRYEDVAEDVDELVDVHEDTHDALDLIEDIVDEVKQDIEEFIEFDEVVEDPVEDFEDELEFEDDYIDEEYGVHSTLESKSRRRPRRAAKEALRNKKSIRKALEATEVIKMCPSCGSTQYSAKIDRCEACNEALRIFRAVESVDADSAFTEIELDDDAKLIIDDNGYTELEDGESIVDLEVTNNTHEVVIDDEEVISVDSGIAETEDGEVAVMVFDATPEEVRDLLVEDNPGEVSVIDTDDGFDLVVDVVSEDKILESGDDLEVDDEPLVLEIDELPGGTALYSEEIDNLDDLADFIKDMIPADVDFDATPNYETDDLEEVEELPALESKGRRKFARKAVETKTPVNRIKSRKGVSTRGNRFISKITESVRWVHDEFEDEDEGGVVHLIEPLNSEGTSIEYDTLMNVDYQFDEAELNWSASDVKKMLDYLNKNFSDPKGASIEEISKKMHKDLGIKSYPGMM